MTHKKSYFGSSNFKLYPPQIRGVEDEARVVEGGGGTRETSKNESFFFVLFFYHRNILTTKVSVKQF